ncbi:tetratricopeptide repeat protein [Xanthobacter sp. KR7-65]|uniref:tetratricopeptide repeat protein n=1 Tax=Xanthobacter sp. KR7-65 TaxID=3156612 RepID=UPI0032B4AF14
MAESEDVPAWDVLDVPASTLESLRGEIGALRERLANAAPKRAVVEMDRAITLLCRRVDDIREAGAASNGRDDVVVAELAEIRAGLAHLGKSDRFVALEAGLEALARKIDLMSARAVDPVEVARLQGQIDEMHNLVLRASASPQSMEMLQKLSARLASCAEDVARVGEETAHHLAEAASAFERNADTLLRRVAETEARARAGDARAAEDLSRRLLGAMDGMHRRLDQMSSHMTAQLATLSPAAGAEMAQRFGALAARIAAAEEAGRAAVAPLAGVMDHHLSVLTEQFRDTQTRLGRLDDIEAGLNRLADEMRHVREATRTVAAEAAAAVATKVSSDPEGAAVVGLKRGLAALEARQNEIERRAGELYAGDVEQELNDIAVALDRDGDGTYAPRAPAPDAFTPSEPAPEPEPEARHPGPQPALEPDALESLLRAAAQAPWPRPGRAVHWALTEAPTTDNRQHAEPPTKAPRKPRVNRPGASLFASLFGRKRQTAMVALVAGAATLFTGLALDLAWRNGPEITAGMTATLRRLAAPAIAGVSPAELPAPLGSPALQAAASNGDPAAAFLVASRYAEGRGTEVDLDAAVKWLSYAVQRGSAPAALRLGALYESAGKDMSEARRLYTWAAEQGNVRAMHALAMLLSEGSLPGLSGKPDWAGAMKWFRAAAELGHRDSQYNLGVIYARGLGVKADLAEAWKWLNLAAAQGDQDSGRKRDMLSRDADAATLMRAQQASASFVAGTPVAVANTVEVRPEWQEAASTAGAAATAPTQVASAAAPGR